MVDSANEGRAGVEDDEIYLVVVTVFAGDVRGGRKSSPKVRRKPSCDLRGYEWRLEKRAVLLESSRREEHRHIYSVGF